MKAKKRCISLLLSLAMLASICFQIVFAAEADTAVSPTDDTAGWTITALSALDEAVAVQRIPQLVEGRKEAAPILPATLEAAAHRAAEEPQPVSLEGIIWAAAPEYDQKIPGEYIYTPTLPKGYALAKGVELPVISVTVEASEALFTDTSDADAAAYNADSGAAAAVTEDVAIVVEGVTYTFDLDTESKTACMTDIANPSQATTVTVPQTIEYNREVYTTTELYWSAFPSKRTNITGLILPDTLIDADVSFSKFPNLTELTIPGSIQNFGGSFQNMSNLQTLTFEEGVEELSGNSMVRNCDSLAVVNLPSTLKRITAPAVFSGAIALTSISLPEGLVITGGSLFSDCTSLTSVVLPASMTEIPSSTFSGCTSLQSVMAKGTITSIGSSAFNECAKLTAIPDLSQATKIGSYAFNECGALPGPVNLGNVAEMGGYAFNNCRKLTGALDLSKLDVIPSHAFTYVADITSIQFSETLTSIGDWAFVWANVDALDFPQTLQTIGTYVFYSAGRLSGTVKIPDSVTSIGKGAFQSTAVEKFEIGSGVESIDASVFTDNTSLREIVFDNSQDNVTITGTLPANVTVTYTQQSIPDNVGDKISNATDAPTLQEAVNDAAAAENGGTVTLEKNIKLDKAVTVPAGQTVTITSEQACQIAGAKTARDLKNLFVVEKGGSLIIDGQVTLFGRYNTGSVVLNYGTLELTGDAIVTGSKITNDLANGTGTSGLGVIDSRGEGAVFTLSGGKITDNELNSSTVSYSGIVRASEGARVKITGGEISKNSASAAAALNCSSGVLLYGNAAGAMSGGSINGNTGHRGGAVMLWGDDADHRTTFELSGNGAISGNVCTSAGKVTGSGAVHVQSNASFTMTGGSISDNKGVQGAGVCVVDGNLQTAQPEYKTTFVMEGGLISGNKGRTGGGVYSYSNGVELKAGKIIYNTAADMGGGIYSEGNYDYYSTLHLSNALIAGNTARQGGGMWFCATGKAAVHVTEGAAIFDNTAQDTDSQKGAGDDFVFSARPADDYPATLANRMLGGGAIQWYKDGAVYLPSTGVYPTTSDTVPRYGVDGAEPNPVTVAGCKDCLALKAIPLSDDVKNAAEKEAALIITGNTADKGGGIGSNGGIVIGTDATTSVDVTKVWSGGSEEDRPASITVDLLGNGVAVDTVTLTAANNWSHTFEALPTADKNGQAYTYMVSETAVPGYTTQITGDAQTGFTITNTKADRYTSLTVEKIWTLDNGGKAAASVQVELLRDGQRYEIVELNEKNGWSYTWEQLNDKYDWSVAEVDIPGGFTSTVSRQGNRWTITNNDVPGPKDSPKPNPKTGAG